jgi:hypothetical protein
VAVVTLPLVWSVDIFSNALELAVDNLLLLGRLSLSYLQVLICRISGLLWIVIYFDHPVSDFGNIFTQGCWC